MPKFERRHYVAMAEDLREERPDAGAVGRDQWEVRVKRMADRFAEDNPRFSRERFLKAAGA
jgi:hypothetical protein